MVAGGCWLSYLDNKQSYKEKRKIKSNSQIIENKAKEE